MIRDKNLVAFLVLRKNTSEYVYDDRGLLVI